MPRQTSKPGRVRLNLDLTQQVKSRIENLRDSTEAESLSEVIRRALASYEMLCEAHASGKKIIVRGEDGEESQVLLLK